MSNPTRLVFGLAALVSTAVPLAHAQPAAPARPAAQAVPANPANPFNLTAEQLAERQRLSDLANADHKRAMQALGLREPGPFPSFADDPNRPANTTPVPGNRYNWSDGVPGHVIVRSTWGSWTNYDLAQADIAPLPEVLTLNNGQRATDADTWWKRRRPEIVALFESEIYGKLPANVPKVTWEVAATDAHALDGKAKSKRLVGHIDNARYPAATPRIELTLYTPAHATAAVPVIVIFGGGFRPGLPPSVQQILDQGWGCAVFNPNALQADTGGALNVGIIGLVNEGKPRKPDDWGSLRALAWGLSRAIDYFETDRDVDAKRLGLEGHSRWGKATLVAAAFEPRWAIAYSSCSGEGGTKLHRHNVGETVDNIAGPGAYHWLAENFLKYGGHWDKLPIDQHELIALVAPRPLFVTGGTEDLWSDPVGEFKACVAASPVYELLGAKGVGRTEMPAPDEALIDGDLAFREHVGGHTDTLDWPVFLKFAARYFNR